jgi:hypothetical protein
MKLILLLFALAFPYIGAAADPQALIRAYYGCGMANYPPGLAPFVSLEDEETYARAILTKKCSKEFEDLRQDLTQFKEQSKSFAKIAGIKESDFSVEDTLRGHTEYARDDIRFLMRLDRLSSCMEFKAQEYARSTREASEPILDASLASCADDHRRVSEIAKALLMSDAQAEKAIVILRQRAMKVVLDQRVKQSTK